MTHPLGYFVAFAACAIVGHPNSNTGGEAFAGAHGDAGSVGGERWHAGRHAAYVLLGVPDHLGMNFRPGGHGMQAADWDAILDFADQKLLKLDGKRRFDQLPAANLLH